MLGAQGLPPALVGLVGPLRLDTDLLADLVHRCRHPLITTWCSEVVEDSELGSAGDALQVNLHNRRLLVHFPDNNFWSRKLADKLLAAI